MKTRTVELIQKFISSHYPLKAEQLAAEYNVSQTDHPSRSLGGQYVVEAAAAT